MHAKKKRTNGREWACNHKTRAHHTDGRLPWRFCACNGLLRKVVMGKTKLTTLVWPEDIEKSQRNAG